MRGFYRLLSKLGDVKAALRGPGPLARRQIRKTAHRETSRVLRRAIRP